VTTGVGPADAGSHSGCKSVWGAFDMIGNVSEWVGDWGDSSPSCTNWPASLGSDLSCVGGPGNFDGQSGTLSLPGAFVRGGGFPDGTAAGVFAISVGPDPSQRSPSVGFRCAREAR
jgi:formylglycine-generating enzyme required for sulfatase activity